MSVAPSEIEHPSRPELYLVPDEPSQDLKYDVSLSSFSRVIIRSPDTNRLTPTRVIDLQPAWVRVNGSGRPEKSTADQKGVYPGIIAIIGNECEIATGACIGLLKGRRFHLVPYRRSGDFVDDIPVEGAREIVVEIREFTR